MPLLDESDDQGWTSPMLKNFAQVAMLNNWGLVISSGAAAGSADVSATDADARRYFSEALQRLRTLDERCEATEADCPANRDTALLSELLDPLARRLGLNESDKAMLLSLLQIAGVPNKLTAEDRQMLATILPILQIIDRGASAADLEAIFNAVLGGVIDSMIAPLATAFVPTLLNNIGETYRYEGQLTQARPFYEEGYERALAALQATPNKEFLQSRNITIKTLSSEDPANPVINQLSLFNL